MKLTKNLETELQQLRKAVKNSAAELEHKTRELQIEASLERVRTVAMSMKQPADMLEVCRIISKELEGLGINEIRNVQTAIINEEKASYVNYEYFRLKKKTTITSVEYKKQKDVFAFVKKMLKDPDGFFTKTFKGDDLKEWIKYQEKVGQYVDPHLHKVNSLHYYFYSIGAGALGVSTYAPLNKESIALFKRFRNVFHLAYRRFVDIEKALAQTKEAQIEAALERVRSRSLAMHKSDELQEVVSTVKERLVEVGLKADATRIMTFKPLQNITEMWISNPGYRYSQKLIAPYFLKGGIVGQDFNAALKSRTDYTKSYSKIEKDAYWDYMFENSDFKNIATERKRFILEASHYNICVAFQGEAALFLARYSDTKYSNVDIEILKRFAKVFEQSYTRFLDLQKAEAQAKEAQIQLALERVRARTMAMQKSDELAEVSSLLFQQLKSLGVNSYSSGFTIWDNESNDLISWMCNADGSMNPQFKMPIAEDDWHARQYESWKNGEDFIVNDMAGELMQSYFRYLRSFPLLDEAFEKSIAAGHPMPKRQVHNVANFSHGNLLFITLEPCPEAHEIFKRFAKVFEQTYRRFLDLQKAEAQARESQIEAALERVRSRSMGMQKSDELKEVIKVVYDQFIHLNINIEHTGFVVDYTPKGDWHFWIADKNEIPSKITHPYFDSVWASQFNEAKEKGIDLFTTHLNFEEKNKFYRELLSYVPDLPEESKQFYFSCPGLAATTVLSDNVSLYIENFSGTPYTDEENKILMRFGKVFQQTYTRFLDLQKAEAQAREAKVETALERVRSRAMAMHSSQELKDVATELRNQMSALGQTDMEICAIHLYDESPDYFESIAAGPVLDPILNVIQVQVQVKLPKHGIQIIEEMMNQYHSEKKDYVLVNHGKKGVEWFELLKEKVPLAYEFVLQTLKGTPLEELIYYWSISDFKGGSLVMTTYVPPDDEVRKILRRFANVFGLAYQRFKDLKQAEAQAREAQIEAALEKVRSASLAMHHSDELEKVVRVLFNKLIELGLSFDGAFIFQFEKETRSFYLWVAAKHLSAPIKVIVPFGDAIAENQIVKDLWNAVERGEDAFNKSYSGKVKDDYFRYVAKHNESKIPESIRNFHLEAESWTATFAAGKNSVVGFDSWSGTFTTQEDFQVLKRFARVFEQAYTRFLDLQKAEAQAKEAQIELGLERVRARSMAMHKSDELSEVVAILFDELIKLDLILARCIIWIFDKETLSARMWMANSEDKRIAKSYFIKRLDHPYYNAIVTGWKERNSKWVYDLKGDDKKTIDRLLLHETELSELPEAVKRGILSFEETFVAGSFNNFGLIEASGPAKPTNEQLDILNRFGKVFDLSYTRFNDLQKAEAQAREAQIESALERVRSRTMAMHKSENLLDVISVLSEQLLLLGFKFDHASFGINNQNNDIEFWMAVKGHRGPLHIQVPYFDNAIANRFVEAQKEGKEFFADMSTPEENSNWIRHLFQNAGVPFTEETKLFLLNSPGYARSTVIMKNIFFMIGNYAAIPYSQEENMLCRRFANVFEQAYIRFLDLQKAEAQAREAQIEASLERVRAHAMAMHDSQDLSQTVNIFFKELKNLGITPMRCGVGEMHDESQTSDLVFTTADKQGELYELPGILKHEGHPVVENIYNYWKRQEEYYPVLQRKDMDAYYSIIKSQMTLPDYPEYAVHYGSYFYFKEGYFFAWAEKEFTEEGLNICRRFTSVLSLTYKRYKDLKKAEANAREAKIEAALERVRAKAMAMHKTEDLNGAVAVVFEELEKLDPGVLRCGLSVLDKEKRTGNAWITSTTEQGPAVQVSGDEAFDIHPLLQGAYDAWLRQKDFYYLLEGEDLVNYYKAVKTAGFELPESQFISSDRKQYCYVAVYHAGGLFAFRETEFPEEAKKVMRRFANVFDLTYKRFLDLQKAEAQAREAKIEAALERVRAHAMAMHNSQDLAATIAVFYRELETFSITPRRCGVGLLNKATRIAELSTMNTTEQGDSIEIIGTLKMQGHPVLEGVYDNWLLQKEYHPVLRGNEIKEYYSLLRPQIAFPDYPNDAVQYGYFFFFNEGGVYAWTEKEMNEDELQIYRRFTTVLSLTYKRYIDLKQAEANEKEAIKQAALDRIRADIASMRTIADLERITPLIWNELSVLGVPFIRCGVFIMDEEEQLIHTFLSTPDGKAIAAFHIPYNTPGNIEQVLGHWRNNKNYIDHWDEPAFIEFAHTLVKQGVLDSPEQYLKTLPHGGFHLHFLPFLQGMLYVGNTTQLSEDEIKLIQSVADAFSTAYARYEDFNKLEAAKKQVDSTLNELQATQRQLIQSEKMASLGELTAGIAHEIQNPLNFVNNFSDVSNELLEEMKDELAKGNIEDAIAIAEDVKQNLDKINHHGKRADGIVKGMLQHSRTSSGQKEPTDINALCDEYLRLAYHGLRAKDKSFNAKFETDFDNSIGKINVVTQEIGRVILNLINNAFYAVDEKKKKMGDGYEPIVSVSTKKDKDKIEITVRDNGNGIPQNVLDKIFQPFFTTKPTGQGTGLGLSLSYDIVKAHGGEIKVETKEGECAEFIIQLPIKENI